MEKKNLVITGYGNRTSLIYDQWLKEPEKKNFDICVFFFDEHINHPEYFEHVDFFYKEKGFKYHFVHDLLTSKKPEFLDQYDYFYLIDDDVSIDTQSINRMFDLCKAFGCWIAQASLSHDSYVSWFTLKHNKSCFARYVGQIEVMAPVFHKDALKICLPTFTFNETTWGVDCVWPKLLGYPENKLVVFDEVQMIHTHPIGGGELYKNSQKNPKADWKAIIKHYDARKENFIEYGRLQKVNDKHSPLKRQQVKLNEQINKLKRQLNDLGIGWRIRNKLGMNNPFNF